MAQHDLPSAIDFVREKTQCESLSFIGYDMGATTLLTALSSKGNKLKD
jgi:poly(3-hydroxyalkanoate) synthetase